MMLSATSATLGGKKRQCQWWLISPTRTETKTASLAFQWQKEHTVHHWHSSPINMSFLGLSKLIASSALCTSISSYWHCFSIHPVWCHPSNMQQRHFFFSSRSFTLILNPARGGQASGFLLQIIQFTSNKLAIKFWTCPSATDVAAERTAPISHCEWKQISDAWSLMNKVIIIYSPLAQLSQRA